MEIKNISINMINSRYTDSCVVLADENLSSKHSRFEAFYTKCFSKCFSRRSCIFYDYLTFNQ